MIAALRRRKQVTHLDWWDFHDPAATTSASPDVTARAPSGAGIGSAEPPTP